MDNSLGGLSGLMTRFPGICAAVPWPGSPSKELCYGAVLPLYCYHCHRYGTTGGVGEEAGMPRLSDHLQSKHERSQTRPEQHLSEGHQLPRPSQEDKSDDKNEEDKSEKSEKKEDEEKKDEEEKDEKEDSRKTANSQGRRKGRITTRSMANEAATVAAEEAPPPAPEPALPDPPQLPKTDPAQKSMKETAKTPVASMDANKVFPYISCFNLKEDSWFSKFIHALPMSDRLSCTQKALCSPSITMAIHGSG
ncbi:hypothetical protein INR49_014995 [Caranx melampygus]|nr:hypothetical protein INR49_014995 [Caranx melampygus]